MNTTELRQPTHREELERTLIGGIACYIGEDPEKASAIAKGIKTVLDELAPKMASGIVIPPIGAPSAGTTASSLSLPVIDPGPDSLEREIQAKAIPAHQQRVLDEKRELDERLSKLDAFILDNPLFAKLSSDEQELLARQSMAMAVYSGILDERIACF